MPQLDAESRISAVTVFADRALVTRSATLDLAPGLFSISFPEIPPTVDADSIRVKGGGAAVAKLCGVEVRSRQYARPADDAVRAAEDQVRRLEERRRTLEEEKALVVEEAAYLRKVADAAHRELGRLFMRGTIEPGAVDARTRHVFDNLARLSGRVRQLDADLRALAGEMSAAQARHRQIATARPDERRVVVVSVEVTKPGKLGLAVQYALPHASWSPFYEVRYDAAAKRVHIVYSGVITQRTGEAWTEAALTLSTARPQVSAVAPRLSRWTVNFYVPPPPMMPPMPAGGHVRARAPAAAAAPGGGGGMDKADTRLGYEPETSVVGAAAAPTPPPVDIVAAAATVEQKGAAAIFRLAKPGNIPSDGEPHKEMIGTWEFSADTSLVVVPRRSDDAHLRTRAVNQSDYHFLPGEAIVFNGDDFVGKSRLPLVPPGGAFQVFLGVDDRVVVAREQTRKDTDATGIFGTGDRRIEIRSVIKLLTTLPEPTPAVIVDQIPVSANMDLKVKVTEQAGAPEIRDDGIVFWRTRLPAKGEVSFPLAFTVEHPKDRVVTGL